MMTTYDSFDARIDLRDPELAKDFLLFYVFEIWEKILQTGAFVHSREHRRRQRMWAVINTFSDVLTGLAEQLDRSSAAYCRQLVLGKEFVFDEFVEAVIRAREVLRALLKLHEKLGLLTGRVENQIAYDFVRKLAKDGIEQRQASWLPFVPSIALTDTYSFMEHDLRSILSSEFEDFGFEPLVPQARSAVLTLPKAEADNPLMWTILAHELAHTMISSYRILDNEIIGRTPGFREADDFSRQVYRNWSLEICADLIALRLLGPSYLFSFSSTGLLMEHQYNTISHPTIVERIGIMAKTMTRTHPEWTITCPETDRSIFTRQELVSLFLRLVTFKHELWTLPEYRRHFLPKGSYFQQTGLELAPSLDLILEAVNRAHVPESELLPAEKRLALLMMLLRGQPVSSHLIEDFDRECFASQLEGITNAKELYDILPPHEEPLTLSTILACGWMQKIYFDYGDLLGQVLNTGSLARTQESYSRILARRHELLQISLNRAFMLQMYWGWRADVNS